MLDPYQLSLIFFVRDNSCGNFQLTALCSISGLYCFRRCAAFVCYFRMGSYLRDALHEGSADVVACLLDPRA
jgi:hypothetical protein